MNNTVEVIILKGDSQFLGYDYILLTFFRARQYSTNIGQLKHGMHIVWIRESNNIRKYGI